MSLAKIIALMLLSFSLAACSLSAAEPTATPSPEPSATQTLATIAPTNTPTNTPTVTPSPTATRTVSSGGQSGGQTVCNYNLSFVADISLPDGTQVFTGSTVTKTWRVRNSGNCNWAGGFTFRQVDGDAMSATTINSPTVAVGQTVDISVTLNVGTNISAYTRLERANFRMYDNAGRAFGDTLYAELAIIAPNSSCTNAMTVVTAPANGTITAGQTLNLSWTVRNTGTCTWQNYRVNWLSTDSVLNVLNLPQNLPTTAPNQTVTFTVQVHLMTTVSGSGTGTVSVMLFDASNVGFGSAMGYQASYNLGSSCTDAMSIITAPANGVLEKGQVQTVTWTIMNAGSCTWQGYRIERMGNDSPVIGDNLPTTLGTIAPNQTVNITVNVRLAEQASGSGTVQLPLILLTNTGQALGSTFFYQATYNVPTVCFYDSDFVADVNIPDNTVFRAGETFTKTWRIRNSGTCAWENFRFVMIENNNASLTWVGIVPYTTLPRVEAGAEVEVSVTLAIASEAASGATLRAVFQVQDSAGQNFGTMPYVQILINN